MKEFFMCVIWGTKLADMQNILNQNLVIYRLWKDKISN